MERTVEVCNACRRFFVSESSVVELYHQLDKNPRFAIPDGDLSISFVSEQRMRSLHQQFLNDPSITDVITFLGDPMMDLAGEVVVCPGYAEKQCKRYGTRFEREVTLYLVHGFLHLSGLKDKTPEDASSMRAAEVYCLQFLNDFNIDIIKKGA